MNNQEKLYNLLTQNNKLSNILEGSGLTIPTTSILLLMRDSLKVIKKTQNEIEKEEIIKLGEEKSKIKITHHIIVSGAGSLDKELILPNKPISRRYLEDFKIEYDITNENQHSIIATKQILPIVKFYSNILPFYVFSYILKERIEKVELNKAKNSLKISTKVIKKGGNFKSAIEIRKTLIHQSEFGLNVNQKERKIFISTKKVKKIAILDNAERAFKEAVRWVDEIYGMIIKKIEKKYKI